MDIRHILLCTDLSAPAQSALPHAARLAKTFDARVTLLTVRESLAPGFHELAEITGHLRRVEHQRSDHLRAARDALTAAGVAVESVEIEGPVAAGIERYAADHRADLIVLGKSGHARASGLPVGSTTTRILRTTDLPVLVAPTDESAPTPSLIVPSYDRICVSTDFSKSSRRGLRCALDLARCFDAQVDLVHVIRLPVVATFLAGEPPLSLGQRSVEVIERKYRAQLDEQAEALEAERLASTIVIGSDVAKELLSHAAEAGGDLIAIPSTGKGAIKRTLFGSTAERVVKLSPLPVLVLPPGFLALWD